MFVMMVSFSTNAVQNSPSCRIFTLDQINVMQQAYDFGKPHNLGWSMAAISWRESSAGVNMANWSDPSFGPFHNFINSVAARHGVMGDDRAMMVLAMRLFNDFDFAAQETVNELNYWISRHGENWPLVWASYNAGNNWNSPRGAGYAEDIRQKIVFLRENRCIAR